MTHAPTQYQRILIIRPSALGDVCRTVPVLASLRRAYPQAQIDWVVQDTFAAAVASHPALSHIVPFPRKRFGNDLRNPLAWPGIVHWLLKIRRSRYDLVLDCQGLFRSAMIAAASGAHARVGLRDAREGAWMAYSQRVVVPPNGPANPVHTVDRMLALVLALGIEPVRDMHLHTAESDRQWWAQRRTALGLEGRSYAVLAPTSRWLSKRWPAEQFAQLIRPLRERSLAPAVLIGSPNEIEQVQPIVSYARGQNAELVSLVGETSVGQTMAVIEQAGLVVANDSAPLHMAVGFDRPCVALFGPTDPAVVGPYLRPEAVIRKYDPADAKPVNFKDRKLGDSLMRLIQLKDVLERIDQIIAPSSSRMAGA